MAQRIQNIPFAKLINTRDLGGTEGFFREALGFSDSDITARNWCGSIKWHTISTFASTRS